MNRLLNQLICIEDVAELPCVCVFWHLFGPMQLTHCEVYVALCPDAGCRQLTNEGFLPHAESCEAEVKAAKAAAEAPYQAKADEIRGCQVTSSGPTGRKVMQDLVMWRPFV